MHALGWAGASAVSDRLGPAGAVARWLSDLARDGGLDGASVSSGELDLSSVVLVTPGARAGRLVIGALALVGDERGLAVSPPTVVTPGRLIATLGARRGLTAPEQEASATASRLAWLDAVRGLSEAARAALLPRAPELGDARAWSAIAGLIASAVHDLSRGGLGVGEARATLAGDPTFPDHERWIAIEQAADAYVRTLASWGLFDPAFADLARVRELAGRAPEPGETIEVVLAGVAELDGLTRRALTLPGVSARALVFAPEAMLGTGEGEHEDGAWFDAFGCPSAAWARRAGVLRDDEIVFEAGPFDQAGAVFGAIASLAGGPAGAAVEIGPDDAAVVCVDASLEAAIEREGARAGVPVRPGGGREVRTGRFGTLLDAVSALLEEGSFGALATLCRHLDALAVLGDDNETGELLGAMDRYASDFLPGALDGRWRTERPGDRAILRRAHERVGGLLGELGCPGLEAATPTRSPSAWMPPVRAMLERVYAQAGQGGEGERAWSGFELASVAAVRAAIDEVAALPADAGERVRASEAIRLVLEALGSAADAEAGASRVEMIGWLEALFEPAPGLVFVGMDNEHVPERRGGGGALLTDSARARLQLAHTRSRSARDAYLFATVCEGRCAPGSPAPAGVRAICGRRDASGDPLWASPLLLNADDAGLVERVRRLTGEVRDAGAGVRAASGERVVSSGARFVVRPGSAHEAVTSMSVTSFKRYLSSPYVFYAKDVLGLRDVEPPGRELDPRGFGTLLHDVLERWARSSAGESEDEDEIASCVLDELSGLAGSRFGTRPSVAVRVQIEIASSRLRGFAVWQAARARAGWRVVATEWDAGRAPGGGGSLPMAEGEAPMALRGRIDRIDRHAESGAWAVLDYKTSSGDKDGEAQSPRQTHTRGRGETQRWVDLQLPLYRHLVRNWLVTAHGVSPDAAAPVLSYVGLPSSGRVCERVADWSREELAGADATAQHVVRKVRAGRFLEEGESPVQEGALGALCGYGEHHVRVRTGEGA
ncbi:MAG: PD-(D/E)XK nuclease family protein [Phycisphaerales bacterium]|nr:MAG: PD-(D/E)XK nuclease family protein [Phycisphaerales bacterium]